ncbi:MAG: InlB B-repeat-containing protein [Paludibacteraceae bacterium]|nr:InlB B-repeat-containing protein [Paludibacteraceae bacterium]
MTKFTLFNSASLKSVLPKRAGMLMAFLFAVSVSAFSAYRVNLNFFVGNEKIKMVGVSSGNEYQLSDYQPDVSGYECRDYTFLGWKVGFPVKGDEIPTLVESVTPIANVNLYAVFDKGSVNDYERIMSMEELTPNKYLIVSYHIYGGEKNFYAMNSTTGTYAYGDYNSWGKLGGDRVWPQDQDNVIYDPEDTYIWHFEDTTSSSGKWKITVDDGDAYLYVGSNRKNWMLYNGASSAPGYEVSGANGEFVIKNNVRTITKVPATDTIFFEHDSILAQDTIVDAITGDTTFHVTDSLVWFDTIMPVPAHNDTTYQDWYLNYVPDEVSMMEDFFITDTVFDQYPIYLYKKASSYTSYPKCEEWTSHYDAVEGFISDSLGCEKEAGMKKLDVTGKWYPNGLPGGYSKGYYMFHPGGCLADGCGTEWAFAGWAMEEPVKPTRIRPTLRTLQGFEAGGQAYNDENLYAVYSKGMYYVKVTDTTDLHDGDVCILVNRNRGKAIKLWKKDTGWWGMEDVVTSAGGDTVVTVASKEAEWTYRAWDKLFINGARYLSDKEKYSSIFKLQEKNPPYTLGINGAGGARWLTYKDQSRWLTFDYKTDEVTHFLTYNYTDGWFYREDENGGGYIKYYWNYEVYRKNGSNYEKVSGLSDLSDGDQLVIVSVEPWDPSLHLAVKRSSSYNIYWEGKSVTLSGDVIESSQITSDKMVWTYRASDQTLWNGSHVLGYGEDEGMAFALYEASEGAAGKYGPYGTFWLRYKIPGGMSADAGFCNSKDESRGWASYYKDFKIFRKNGSKYEKVSSTSALNDGDVLVIVQPHSDPGTYAVTETSSSNTRWNMTAVTLHSDTIHTAETPVSDKMEYTYRASDHTLWNVHYGNVLGHNESESTAYALRDASEYGGEAGRFWMRYYEMPPFFCSKVSSSGDWEFLLYHKSGDSFVRARHYTDLSMGDTVLIVRTNKDLALTYVAGCDSAWAQTLVTTSGDYITSVVTPEMKWVYNDSTRTLTHEGHLLANKEDSRMAYVVSEAASLPGWGGTDGRFCLIFNDPRVQYLAAYTYSGYGDWFISPSCGGTIYKDIITGNVHLDDAQGALINVSEADIYFDIYRKSDEAEYSSYPHCAPYSTVLHACGGHFGVATTRDTIIAETNVGQGFVLPNCTADCDGWDFVGWFPDEDKQSFEMLEFKDFYAPGTVFVPKNDGAELFAIYTRKTDKFKIVRGGPSALVDGDEYLMTYYTKVNGSAKIYDQEITGVKYNSQYLRAKQGESPQNGDDYYMIEADPANIWVINKKANTTNEYYFKNYKTNEYLVLGTGRPCYSTTQAAQNAVYVLDAGKNFEFNVCCKSGNTYYSAYCNTSARFTVNKRQMSSNGLYSPFSYIFRRMKEFSSWPHCEPFSVHFVGCGGTVETTDVSEEVRYGGVVTPEAVPSLECAKMGWEFAGWYKKPIYKELFELSFDIVPGNSHYTPAAKSDTLYAVYQQRTDRYDRIFGIPDLHLGGNYVIATAPELASGKRHMAMSNTLDNDNNPSKLLGKSIESVYENDTIMNEDPSIVWRLAGNWGEYVFYNMNRKVYLNMREPGKVMFAASDTTDQADVTYDASTGYKFRAVKNISGNNEGQKFLGYNGGYFKSVTYNSSELLPLAIYRQECYYQSFPECYQEVEALYWNKRGPDDIDYWVTVESYLLRGTPDLHNSIGNPKENGDGTFDIRYHAGLMRPCTRALMTWDGVTSEFRVPYIVSENTTTSQLLGHNRCDTCDVVVTKGNTLTVNEDRTIRILTLQDSATLNVLDGTKLRAQQVVLFSDGDQNTPFVNLNGSGEIILKNGELYVDRRIDENRFYWFTLPYDAKVSEINFSNEESNGFAAKYNVEENGGYFLNYYDGARRAADVNAGILTQEAINNGATYWTRVPANATLNAGQGYQVGLYDQWATVQPDGRHHKKRVIRFTTRPDGYLWNNQEHNLGKVAPINASTVTNPLNKVHAGWNLIGNPYIYTYTTGSTPGISGISNGAWKGDTVNGVWNGWVRDEGRPTNIPYLTIYNLGYKRYYQVLASDYTLRPGEVVFVQVESGNGISFTHNPNVSPKPSSMLVSLHEAPLYTGIKLTGNGMMDRTGVVLNEEYSSAEYEIGGDLAKMASSKYLNLYSFNDNNRKQRLAFNGMSDVDADSTLIPLGVVFPSAGEYTFSFDAETYDPLDLEALFLVDESTNEFINLLAEDYKVKVNKAQTMENRFYLFVRRVKRANDPDPSNPSSNIDLLSNEQAQSSTGKFMLNGILYIVRDGKIYDALGTQVK